MLPTHYLERIISVFHCLRLDNWRAVVVAVNLRMFWVPWSIRNNIIYGF